MRVATAERWGRLIGAAVGVAVLVQGCDDSERRRCQAEERLRRKSAAEKKAKVAEDKRRCAELTAQIRGAAAKCGDTSRSLEERRTSCDRIDDTIGKACIFSFNRRRVMTKISGPCRSYDYCRNLRGSRRRHKKIRITLNDGRKIWANAVSSCRASEKGKYLPYFKLLYQSGLRFFKSKTAKRTLSKRFTSRQINSGDYGEMPDQGAVGFSVRHVGQSKPFIWPGARPGLWLENYFRLRFTHRDGHKKTLYYIQGPRLVGAMSAIKAIFNWRKYWEGYVESLAICPRSGGRYSLYDIRRVDWVMPGDINSR